MSLLTGQPIESTYEGIDSEIADIFAARYIPHTRKVLKMGNWKFAQSDRVKLSKVNTDPDSLYPWRYMWQQPAAYVEGAVIQFIHGTNIGNKTVGTGRILKKVMQYNYVESGNLYQYAKRRNRIATLVEPVDCVYIQEVPISSWDQCAVDLLGVSLAMEAAESINDEQNVKQFLASERARLMLEAENSWEQPPTLNAYDKGYNEDDFTDGYNPLRYYLD